MSSQTEVAEILYSKIRSIGKKKIRADIALNVNTSQEYIHNILSECIEKLNLRSKFLDDKDDNRMAVLAEALLHFMLTASTLPSQRKIAIKDKLSIDVIVPSLQTLKTDPDKSIIVQFINDILDLNKISELELLQPNYKNIWLIYTKELVPVKKYMSYGISSNTLSHKSYSNIIIDIDKFLKDKRDKSLRFFH
jgi:hypothetical protein